MPATGDLWIVLDDGQILDFSDLDTYLVDGLRRGLAETVARIYGEDTTIGTVRATFGYSPGLLSLMASAEGVTPAGWTILADSADPAWAVVPFADTGATVYNIAARRNPRPVAVTGATSDGSFSYVREAEATGELGAPNAVSDTGAGLELELTDLVAPGWTGAGTRPVAVWLVHPVTASADAIYEGVAEYDAGAGTVIVTIPHYLGQVAPSLTAADYLVMVRGPTVRSAALDPELYWVLGVVASGVFSNAAQTVTPRWGAWLSMFAAEHDAGSGVHRNVTAIDLTATPAANTSPGARIRETGGTAKVELIPGAPTGADQGGIMRFPRPDRSSNGRAMIDVGPRPGKVGLRITNSNGLAADNVEIEIDGVLRKDVARSAAWALEVDAAAAHTLYVRNVGAGVAHLNVDGSVTAAGALTAIGTATLALNTTIDSVEGVSTLGVEVSPIGSGLHGVRYNPSASFTIPMSPVQGGWTQVSDPTLSYPAPQAGPPSYVLGSAAAVATAIRRDLPGILYNNSAPGTVYRLESIDYRHWVQTAGDTLSVSIRRQLRDGTGGTLTVANATVAGAAAAWLAGNLVLAHDVDPLYEYWAAITLTPAASPSNVRIANVGLNVTKYAIE